jgi:hypothetical protein
MNDTHTPDRAIALRSLLFEAGRTLGGEGVDRLRRAVLAMAASDDLALRSAGRYFSAALGAALEMIAEPDADLPALASTLDHAYALGLDAWFGAQEQALTQAARPRAANLLALRASGAKELPATQRQQIEDLLLLIKTGRRAAGGDLEALEALGGMQ